MTTPETTRALRALDLIDAGESIAALLLLAEILEKPLNSQWRPADTKA